MFLLGLAAALAAQDPPVSLVLDDLHLMTEPQVLKGLDYMLRLKLRREYPDRLALLHRRAARWHERNGQLTDAVRRAARAGDWQLAASMVIDDLAITEIIEQRGSPSLADEFGGMPHGRAWTETQPHLVSATVALAAGRHEFRIAALNATEAILERLPAAQQVACRPAAAVIRVAVSVASAI